MHFVMCREQLEAYRSGNVERLNIGLFRCAHADPDIVDDDETCDYVGLWEAPLECWEPECPECRRPAALVEIVSA
jgi:hypothetical protein